MKFHSNVVTIIDSASRSRDAVSRSEALRIGVTEGAIAPEDNGKVKLRELEGIGELSATTAT